jgi:hypothetical protein
MTDRKAPTVRVYYFDFVDNHCGRWTRYHYATRKDACDERRRTIANLGVPVKNMEFCGEYGDVTRVTRANIELTQAGVLLALNGADPNGE